MEELDKLKESIIDRYKMALALNGDEICKEIESVLSDDLDLMLVKASCYCVFYLNKKNGVDPKLYEKCEKFSGHFRYYNQKINILV